jgi:hypothetical protein
LGPGRQNIFFESAAGPQGFFTTARHYPRVTRKHSRLSSVALHRDGPKAARISHIGLASLFSLANPGENALRVQQFQRRRNSINHLAFGIER